MQRAVSTASEEKKASTSEVWLELAAARAFLVQRDLFCTLYSVRGTATGPSIVMIYSGERRSRGIFLRPFLPCVSCGDRFKFRAVLAVKAMESFGIFLKVCWFWEGNEVVLGFVSLGKVFIIEKLNDGLAYIPLQFNEGKIDIF